MPDVSQFLTPYFIAVSFTGSIVFVSLLIATFQVRLTRSAPKAWLPSHKKDTWYTWYSFTGRVLPDPRR